MTKVDGNIAWCDGTNQVCLEFANEAWTRIVNINGLKHLQSLYWKRLSGGQTVWEDAVILDHDSKKQ